MRTDILVFGDGLLGTAFKVLPKTEVLSKDRCNILNKDDIKEALNYFRPKVVVNAAGIVPKHPANVETTFKVNAFAPHYIADVCYRKCYFIHISTDCVFSGKRGMYTEKDDTDARDIYGMSKQLGEPSDGLVVRTSFIGLPDPKQRGLLAWAEKQSEITGYDRVFWNGVTTLELITKLLNYVHEEVTGVRHVYSYTMSKYELLKCAKNVFGWKMPIYRETDIQPDPHSYDKTLSSIYATGFISKPIKQQLRELNVRE